MREKTGVHSLPEASVVHQNLIRKYLVRELFSSKVCICRFFMRAFFFSPLK